MKDETPSPHPPQIDSKTGQRLGNQLDIAALRTLKKAAHSAGTLHRDNFPAGPKGQERFERALRNIGREQLPKTPEGHADYAKSFYTYNGMINNTIYNVLRIYNQRSDELLTKTLIEIANKSATEDGFGQREDGSEVRFIDISNEALGYVKGNHEETSHILDNMIVWSVLHRVLVHVDPVTSELLANTEPPTSHDGFNPLDFVKKWPTAVIHDSRPIGANGTGKTYLVTGAFDPTTHDLNSTESVLDIEWVGVIVYEFGNGNCDGKSITSTVYTIPTGADMSNASDEVKWLCNAYALATSFPTYIKRPLESKKQNAAFGKRRFEPAVQGTTLTAAIQSRTLNQIITEQHENPGSNAGGWTVKPHWRVGHWKKVYHGVRWEVDNPDKTVFEDDLGRRYHMSYIMPTLVNQDKFLGDPGTPD